MTDSSQQELRCFCRRHPMLAKVGTDFKTGKPYVHVRSFRGERLYAEVEVLSGTVRITCRECLRKHEIVVTTPDVRLPPGIQAQ